VQFVVTASDGEYMHGERSDGRPIPDKADASGQFSYASNPKLPGFFSMAVNGPFTVRLASDPEGSGTSPTVCVRLDGSKNLDVVLALVGA
jgi:hypothetical protein